MSESVADRPPAPSLTSRAIGIITAPRATFEKIVPAPRVGGALALVAGISALMVGGFLATDVGQQAWIDQAVASQEAWGIEVTDEAYAELQRAAPRAPFLSGLPYLFIIPISCVVAAGVLYAIFNGLMGGTAAFRQLLAIVAHSQLVMALALLVSTPINYLKGAMTGATSLAVLFPMLDESSFAARLLGMIDVFVVWYLIVLAIGVSVLYGRRTRAIAIVLFGIYAAIALGVALFQSSRGLG
jgi:hypothetical protein